MSCCHNFSDTTINRMRVLKLGELLEKDTKCIERKIANTDLDGAQGPDGPTGPLGIDGPTGPTGATPANAYQTGSESFDSASSSTTGVVFGSAYASAPVITTSIQAPSGSAINSKVNYGTENIITTGFDITTVSLTTESITYTVNWTSFGL